MHVNFNNKEYNLHIVNKSNFELYESFLDDINICNSELIKQSYEKVSYLSLDEDGYFGFFVTDLDNSTIFMSIIININCNQISNKLTADMLNNIDINNSVEIILVCSNEMKRKRGLATYMMNKMITQFIPSFLPNCKHILLYVANRERNENATNFYINLNFGFVKENEKIMIYNYQNGGKWKGKRRRKYTIRKCKKIKKYKYKSSGKYK
jgi:hypothetical protein